MQGLLLFVLIRFRFGLVLFALFIYLMAMMSKSGKNLVEKGKVSLLYITDQ